MKNNPLECDDGQPTGAEEKAAKLQIAAAKLQQKENARHRASLQQGSKSGSAAQLTATPQSEVTEQPPNLYQVTKINIPDNLGDITRLLHAELTKIAQSQSIILTLWEKYRQSQSDVAELKAQVRQLQQKL